MNRSQQPEEQKPLIAQAVEARYSAENLPQERLRSDGKD